MEIDRKTLADIVDKSRNLQDYLHASPKPFRSESACKHPGSYFEKWINTAVQGDKEAFSAFLANWGLTMENAACMVGGKASTDKPTFPDWADTLIQVLGYYGSKNALNCSLHSSEKAFSPIAFEDIFMPFVSHAEFRLKNTFKNVDFLLFPSALADMEYYLLKQLSVVYSNVMELEFSTFRSMKRSSFDNLFNTASHGESCSIYLEFSNQMKCGGILAVFTEYPVLARLLCTFTDLWVDSDACFMVRLEKDLPEINELFSKGKYLSQISDIRMGISDRHNGGQSAIIATFRNGFKIVYKPRDLNIEVEYDNLLQWIDKSLASHDFRQLNIINKSTYGWMEFCEHLPCKNESEVESYYYRAGMLLALMYSLNGTDFHFENIIANGSYPVIIDLETLFHQQLYFREPYSMPDSLESTYLLPPQYFEQDDKKIDISGFGAGSSGTEALPEVLDWENINTDDMKRAYHKAANFTFNNLPSIDNHIVSPHDYINTITSGFKRIYVLLMENRDFLLSDNSPIVNFSNKKTRFVFRFTNYYRTLSLKALQPEYLRDGFVRSIELCRLYQYIYDFDSPLSLWPIFEEELKAVEIMDIPYFSTDTSNTGLYSGNIPIIQGCFKKSSYQLFAERLSLFNEKHLSNQIVKIEDSLKSVDYNN